MWVDYLRSKVQDQPDQHSETPVSTNNTKLARHSGACLQSQLLGRLKQENGLNPGGRGFSELRSRHCSLLWTTRAKLSQRKKKEKKKGREKRAPRPGWARWLTAVSTALWDYSQSTVLKQHFQISITYIKVVKLLDLS